MSGNSMLALKKRSSSIAFNAEGTKMFVLGYNGEDVNEYNLTSAFRVANDTGSVGSALIGAYGTLTMSSDGSYTYAANSSIVGLDSGESVYDYFTYTVDDGLNDNSTDTAELKITTRCRQYCQLLETMLVLF